MSKNTSSLNSSNKNTYRYYIYGEIIISNIELPLLETITLDECEESNIQLNVSFGCIKKSSDTGVNISKSNNLYTITISDVVKYNVYENENRIDCLAENFETFFSTFFNIPFSIYFLLREELLVHCCSILMQKKCICIAGEKGTGKSTLVSLLNDDECTIFGDDTLRVRKNLIAYRAHNLIKITDETANNLAIPYHISQYTNLTGKRYGILPINNGGCSVNALVELYLNESVVKLRKIDNALNRNIVLRRNIVGVNYFDKNLLRKAHSVILDPQIDCFVLDIPNNLAALIREQANIKKELRDGICIKK